MRTVYTFENEEGALSVRSPFWRNLFRRGNGYVIDITVDGQSNRYPFSGVYTGPGMTSSLEEESLSDAEWGIVNDYRTWLARHRFGEINDTEEKLVADLADREQQLIEREAGMEAERQRITEEYERLRGILEKGLYEVPEALLAARHGNTNPGEFERDLRYAARLWEVIDRLHELDVPDRDIIVVAELLPELMEYAIPSPSGVDPGEKFVGSTGHHTLESGKTKKFVDSVCDIKWVKKVSTRDSRRGSSRKRVRLRNISNLCAHYNDGQGTVMFDVGTTADNIIQAEYTRKRIEDLL